MNGLLPVENFDGNENITLTEAPFLIHHIQDYQEYTNITINGNDQLLALAGSEGWSGNGTMENPILIENVNVTHTVSTPLISIQNTNLAVTISSSLFVGGSDAIYLFNASLISIESNIITISFCSEMGGKATFKGAMSDCPIVVIVECFATDIKYFLA